MSSSLEIFRQSGVAGAPSSQGRATGSASLDLFRTWSTSPMNVGASNPSNSLLTFRQTMPLNLDVATEAQYPGNRIPSPGEFPLTTVNYKGEPTVEPWIKGRFTGIGRDTARLQAIGAYEPPPERKPNLFWRTLNKLSMPNAFFAGFANALARGKSMEDAAEDAVKSAAAMWHNKPEEAKFYKDMLVSMGMTDRKGKVDLVDALGFALDVFADPTTYLGSGLVKGAGKGGKLAATMAEQANTGRKILPGLVAGADRYLLSIGWGAKRVGITSPKVWSGLEKAGAMAKGLPVLKQLGNTFIPLYDMSRKMDEAGNLIMPHGKRQQFKEMAKYWGGILDGLNADDARFITDTLQGLNKAELEILPFLREGVVSHIPNLLDDAYMMANHGMAVARPLKDKLAAAYKMKDAEHLAPILKKVGDWFDLKGLEQKELGLVSNLVEKYVLHDYMNVGRERTIWQKLFGLGEDIVDGQYGPGDVGSIGKRRTFRVGEAITSGRSGGMIEAEGLGLIDAIAAKYIPNLNMADLMIKYSQKSNKAKYLANFSDDFLGKFGVPLEKFSKVGQVGEKIWVNRKWAKMLGRIQEVPSEWLAKDADHLIPMDAKQIGALEKAGFKPKAFAVPSVLSDQVNRVLGYVGRDQGVSDVGKALRGFTSFFRRWALATPGTNSRNAQGIIYKNWVDANILNPGEYITAARELASGKGFAQEARKIGTIGQDTVEALSKSMPSQFSKHSTFSYINPLSEKALPVHLMGKMMRYIEDVGRYTLYRNWRKKGMTAREASLRTFAVHYDYRRAPTNLDFTAVEQNVMRELIPFYSWLRMNIPHELKTLVTQPGKHATVGKILNQSEMAGTETAEEREYRRNYMEDLMARPIPKQVQEIFQAGLAKIGFKHTGNMLINPNFPFQDIARWSGGDGITQEIIGSMHPVLKYAFERIPYEVGGKSMDLFSGKRLSPNELDTAPLWLNMAYKLVPATKDVLSAAGVATYVAPDGRLMIPPIELKAIETALPPAMWLKRFMPKDLQHRIFQEHLPPELLKRLPQYRLDDYLDEPGRAWDLYLTAQLSNIAGIKFILPAVLSEKKRRLLIESERLRGIKKRYEEMGVEFPEFQSKRTWIPVDKIIETPEQYLARVQGGYR